ncbi:hypothetical protein AKO1_002171 [Acrasis kona]|uniref:Uncharacterized protein n=1 Tax=Acrasis kona TaxID=1008807 RepID=A0AAW2Z7Y5_9EUKA
MAMRALTLQVFISLFLYSFARFAVLNQFVVSERPYTYLSSQITEDHLYLFADKNFDHIFLKVDLETSTVTHTQHFDNYVIRNLAPFFDIPGDKMYFIYLYLLQTQYRISSFNLKDLSYEKNSTFDVTFYNGVGLLNSYMKSIYIPEEDFPMGNQLKQVHLSNFTDTGRIVNLDEFGVVLKKYQKYGEPIIYAIAFHQDIHLNILDFSIIKYDLVDLKVIKSWTTKDPSLYAYTSCFVPGGKYLGLGLGAPNVPTGVALFDLESFNVEKQFSVMSTFNQKSYPTILSSNGKDMYFTTSNRDLEHRDCMVWKVSLSNFTVNNAEHVYTQDKKGICNVVMLESNNRGSYFATDLGRSVFHTN